MENPKISETTREKLEDAAVSVFMDQYAKALDAGINKQMEECADHEFPEELDKRCRALIEREYVKAKREKHRKSVLRVLRSAAIVAVVMLSMCSVLFVTVEAFRMPIMNFFVEKTDRYWELSAKPNEDWVFEGFNEENPLEDIIPYDFVLENVSGSLEAGDLAAKYVNGTNTTIFFFIDRSMGKLQIDGEDAFISECKVSGHDAKLYVESETVRIAWLDENISRTCYLFATNVSQEAVKCFAEAIADCFV